MIMFFEKYRYFPKLLCILIVCGCCAATSADPSLSYDILYAKGVEAYLDEDWEQCITLMNEAIEDYHFYIDAQVGCRLSCRKQSSDKYVTPQNLTDLRYWESMIKQTLCILKCKKNVLKNRAEVISRSVSHDFESFKPYDYLQLCYFKVCTVYTNYNIMISNRFIFIFRWMIC